MTSRSKRGGTLALSWGPSGGVYANAGYCKRVCLGRLALTYVPLEIDEVMDGYAESLTLSAERDDLATTIRRAYRQLSNTETHTNSQWVNSALDTLRGKVSS